jgi:hypothetical protein
VKVLETLPPPPKKKAIFPLFDKWAQKVIHVYGNPSLHLNSGYFTGQCMVFEGWQDLATLAPNSHIPPIRYMGVKIVHVRESIFFI